MTQKIFKSLCETYTQMDQAWDTIARNYGFQCNGCNDNCCKSLFFHHTKVEKAYLRHGFSLLDTKTQKKILGNAKNYLEKTFQEAGVEKSKKIMCPVNENGSCLLYPFRPMICRLHGLPHELCRPNASKIMGPGCDAGNFEDKPYIAFDRTPFYREMARIEISFCSTTGQAGRIKETIAHMLTTRP